MSRELGLEEESRTAKGGGMVAPRRKRSTEARAAQFHELELNHNMERLTALA
jgi:hypothetical protein